MEVTNNMIVSIRFKLMNDKSEILEQEPIIYLHGTGSISPILEGNLTGLKAGDKKTFCISEAEGYPGVEENFSCEVIIDNVRWASEEELKSNNIFEKYIDNCGSKCCC